MAESNVVAPIFRWANWWIADDIFTGINNSYFYSENIEVINSFLNENNELNNEEKEFRNFKR